MRLADFTDDEAAAATAEDIGRALVVARARVQQLELARLIARGEPLAAEDLEPPQPEVLYGSAVIHDGERMRAVLLVDARAVEDFAASGGTLPAVEVPVVRDAVSSLAELTGVAVPLDLHALAMPEPIPYFAPGDQANGPGTIGTFGALARDAAGTDCILTAGHVAAAGTQVTDATGGIGDVVFSHNPAAVAGPAPSADVAVVVPRGRHGTGRGVAIATPGKSAPGEGVEVHGALTPAGSTWTMGFSPSLFVPSMAGMWGEVYFTTTAASMPGDSGAPVLRAGTDEIVGHVVGGAPGMTSFVQSIDLHLTAAGCSLRSSP